MKKFNIGDKVVVDNPIGSYNEKFKGMKGKIIDIYRFSDIPILYTGVIFSGFCTLKLEFDTISDTSVFSVHEVSPIE